MTEEEKQQYLIFMEEMLRQAEPQFNTLELEQLRDNMFKDLDKNFDSQLAQIPLQLQEIINVWQSKLRGIKKMIEHIKNTDAADLTKENIAAAAK
ncbi:MAG TPA: hypothetical protein VF598_10700 [Hymenobacter sp.]|jgi:hypothetical protein